MIGDPGMLSSHRRLHDALTVNDCSQSARPCCVHQSSSNGTSVSNYLTTDNHDVDNGWSLTGFVKNLTDNRFIVSSDSNFGIGFHEANFNEPREFGVTA